MKRIKDKNGKTIAMDIKFPHDEFLDNKGINGMEDGNVMAVMELLVQGDHILLMILLFSENFNWEAFWNR